MNKKEELRAELIKLINKLDRKEFLNIKSVMNMPDEHNVQKERMLEVIENKILKDPKGDIMKMLYEVELSFYNF